MTNDTNYNIQHKMMVVHLRLQHDAWFVCVMMQCSCILKTHFTSIIPIVTIGANKIYTWNEPKKRERKENTLHLMNERQYKRKQSIPSKKKLAIPKYFIHSFFHTNHPNARGLLIFEKLFPKWRHWKLEILQIGNRIFKKKCEFMDEFWCSWQLINTSLFVQRVLRNSLLICQQNLYLLQITVTVTLANSH